MADTSKYTAYKNKFQAENYDRINFVVPKGQKAEIQDAAKAAGESTNAYILRAVYAQMEREGHTRQEDSEDNKES